jgi:hypothetical protein|tara:strand:+ start:223 stop:987 length:765 start_codon:yes stop_codon:yes gene_type:complete
MATEHKIEYHDGSEVILSFDPKKHYYTVDEKYAPSVTTVLDSIAKPALIPWAASEGAKFFKANVKEFTVGDMSTVDMEKGIRGAYRKRSGDALVIGQQVHEWAEKAILWKLGRGDAPSLPDSTEAKSSIGAFREWVKTNDIEWVSAEEKVFHPERWFAGTVDAVARVNGEFSVIDFKTSAAIYTPYHLQCAAYAKCVQLIYGEEVEKAYILRFDKKTGDFEAQASSEIEENFRAFLGFLIGYRRLKDLENKGSK